MWFKIILFLSLLIVVLFIVGTIFGYYLLKYIYTELRTDHYQTYSDETTAMLSKYHDCRIMRAHVVQRKIPVRLLVVIYILRLFISDELRQSTIESKLYHQSILLEVETTHGPRLLLLEKTCEMVLRDYIQLTQKHTMKPLLLSSKKHTVGSLLTSTQKTMGNERFFNWRVDSTCQTLVSELATHLHQKNQVDILNGFDTFSKEDAYILNNLLFYYYKLMLLIRIDKYILKQFT